MRVTQDVLKNDGSVVYQPVVELGDLRIIFYEVLFRLGQFDTQLLIQAAEASGDIAHIDEFALSSALTTLRRHRDISLSVNISIVSIERASARLLMQFTQPRSVLNRLYVEVTESSDIHKQAIVVAFLQAIRVQGVRLAIDDFGDGYADNQRVLLLKPDIVKIVAPATEADLERWAVERLEPLVVIADSVDAKVVVERLEQEEGRRIARKYRAFGGQGYLFGKPQVLMQQLIVDLAA